jgi:transcriptional regulator
MSAWDTIVRTLEAASLEAYYKSVLTARQAEALILHEKGWHARQIGRHFGVTETAGRLIVLRAKRRLKVANMKNAGMTVDEIAESLGVSKGSVYMMMRPQEE